MSPLGLDTPQSCSLYTDDLWVSVNHRLPQKAASLTVERCAIWIWILFVYGAGDEARGRHLPSKGSIN